jgi:hypothetical protein
MVYEALRRTASFTGLFGLLSAACATTDLPYSVETQPAAISVEEPGVVVRVFPERNPRFVDRLLHTLEWPHLSLRNLRSGAASDQVSGQRLCDRYQSGGLSECPAVDWRESIVVGVSPLRPACDDLASFTLDSHGLLAPEFRPQAGCRSSAILRRSYLVALPRARLPPRFVLAVDGTRRYIPADRPNRALRRRGLSWLALDLAAAGAVTAVVHAGRTEAWSRWPAVASGAAGGAVAGYTLGALTVSAALDRRCGPSECFAFKYAGAAAGLVVGGIAATLATARPGSSRTATTAVAMVPLVALGAAYATVLWKEAQ